MRNELKVVTGLVLSIVGILTWLTFMALDAREKRLNEASNCPSISKEYKACNEWGESKIRQMCEAAATTKAMGCYGVTSDSL